MAFIGVPNAQATVCRSLTCSLTTRIGSNQAYSIETLPEKSGMDGVAIRFQHVLVSCFLFSVTRLGNLLDFGQLFKPLGNNYFAQIFPIPRQFLYRCENLYFFQSNHFWATFIDIWRFFLVTLFLLTLYCNCNFDSGV